MNDLEDLLGDRKICVAREVTKSFETILSGNIADVRTRISAEPGNQKGEFVLVVDGASEEAAEMTSEVQSLLLDLAAELAPKQAAKIVARHTGLKSKVLYDWLLMQKV